MVVFHPPIHLPPAVTLTIDSITPPSPVEKTQAVVAFTVNNATDHDTIKGAINSSWVQTTVVPVDPIPAQGGIHRGTITVVVPKAGADRLELFYVEETPGVEFPGPTAQDEATVDVAGTFVVTIDKIHIDNTRAVHNDTDYVNLAMTGGREQANLNEWKRLGDVNNGDHGVGLTLGPVTLGSNDQFGFSYQVINHGNDLADVRTFFDDVSGAAAQVLSAIFAGTDWSKGDALTKFINSVQFADCDGYVAVDGIGPLDGARLISWTSQAGAFQVPISYPPVNIDPTTYDKIYKSATGCGSTSNYTVYWTVRRTSF